MCETRSRKRGPGHTCCAGGRIEGHALRCNGAERGVVWRTLCAGLTPPRRGVAKRGVPLGASCALRRTLGEKIALLCGAIAEADEGEEAEEAEADSADDVPCCGLGEPAGEGVADLIGDGVGRIHADDEENDADDQEDNSDNALRVHDIAFYREWSELLNGGGASSQ